MNKRDSSALQYSFFVFTSAQERFHGAYPLAFSLMRKLYMIIYLLSKTSRAALVSVCVYVCVCTYIILHNDEGSYIL